MSEAQLREQLVSTPTGQGLLSGTFLLPEEDDEEDGDAELASAPDGRSYFFMDGSDMYLVVVKDGVNHIVQIAPVVIPPVEQNVVISATEPTSPDLGLVWVDTSDDEHVVLWVARDDGA
jgi:hypothetical protein